ncbi:MAG: hypothetical protein HOD92_21235 [Deltaproteobacteria bacterium]|jgi:hypothetical protein|nr:hypothetical protein [Deltaproteobacteria bacterium]MBT4525657.1 hypothetical protein [Deltaproteobacteria bacterium]
MVKKSKIAYDALKVSKETYETICGFSISALDLPDKLPDDLAVREKHQSVNRFQKYGIMV